ncbi:hypothetical protein VIGAN_05143900 [Vigna angularis var. angularis]|uniref:Uncharacterized protein n=1 Tax=Vigna angularis var. angularis TaxID=157739 RepID=A0A0S3S5B1_PHAAN|nr:hypothetical protein VIGAN_05143900 [Vigna angularis var. angularis]
MTVKVMIFGKNYHTYLLVFILTHILRWPSSELVLDTSLSSGFRSSFSLLLDTSSAMVLLGGAEQTGTTDLILTAGALNRGVGVLIMPNLSGVDVPGLSGMPVLNLDAACCGLEPTDEVGHMVRTMEDDEGAGGLKLLL